MLFLLLQNNSNTKGGGGDVNGREKRAGRERLCKRNEVQGHCREISRVHQYGEVMEETL